MFYKIAILFSFLFIFIRANVFAQFGKGSDWHTRNMPDKKKMKYSRIEKSIGCTLIITGVYLARNNQNPQGIDVPMIIVGTLLTIEGIRLRKTVKSKYLLD